MSTEDLRLVLKASHDYQEYLNELLTAFKDWQTNRTDTIKSLQEIVTDMDSDEFKKGVTELVSSAFGTGGSISVLLGIAVSTITGGASLIAAEIGVVVDFLAGVTNLVTDGFNNHYVTKKCIEADKLIKGDQKKLEKLAKAEETFLKAFVVMNKNDKSMINAFNVVHITVLSVSGKEVYEILKSRIQSMETEAKEIELAELKGGAGIAKAEQVGTASKLQLMETEAKEIELAELKGGARIAKAEQVGTASKLQLMETEAKEIELAELKGGARIAKAEQVGTASRRCKVVVGQIGRAASTIGKLSGVLAIADLGLNIWTIKCSVEDISKGSKSELGKRITDHIRKLESSREEIEFFFKKTYTCKV